MAKALKKSRIPRTDSIQELAEFWDTHDSTDFEDELVEVTEPVFERGGPIQINLESAEKKALQLLAEAQGLSEAQLIGTWVRKELGRKSGRSMVKSRTTANGRTHKK